MVVRQTNRRHDPWQTGRVISLRIRRTKTSKFLELSRQAMAEWTLKPQLFNEFFGLLDRLWRYFGAGKQFSK